MKRHVKTIIKLFAVIVIAAMVLYLACACMPSFEELKQMKEKCKAKKEAKERKSKWNQNDEGRRGRK